MSQGMGIWWLFLRLWLIKDRIVKDSNLTSAKLLQITLHVSKPCHEFISKLISHLTVVFSFSTRLYNIPNKKSKKHRQVYCVF